MEKIEEEISAKDELLKELQRKLNALLNRKPVAKPVSIKYKGVKGDEIDMALAEYINLYGSPVPWKRTSIQNYLYGTKKVIVKWIRQNLVIKVGGGSMMIQEFVATYEDIELAKMEYFEHGSTTGLQVDHSGLSKVEKIAIARGSSPHAAGSPTRKLAASMNQNLTKMMVGSGGQI